MFLWFIGAAVLTVWYVFRDPRFDYRLLVVGSVVPDLDVVFGGSRVMHSLVFSVVLLFGVMVLTTGRRPVRRRLLGLPIGTFLHLVFDGAWATTTVFWWPFGGWNFDDARLPSVARGWWFLPMEVAGLGMIAWIWRRGDLSRPERRAEFRATGTLALAAD